MGLFDSIDPIASAVFGGGNDAPHQRKPYVQPRPVPVRLTLPAANPDWNTATVKAPVASQHGWSGHSLQSYLQTFQRGGGPAPGQQIATTQSLFPSTGAPVAPDWGSLPNVNNPSIEPGQSDIIQSLVKNSVGGEMSPAAAALYGRMLGATPPPAVAATQPATVKPSGIPPVGAGTGNPRESAIRQNGLYNQGFNAGKESLYRGMTPLQKQQANAVYNVTQPASPTLR